MIPLWCPPSALMRQQSVSVGAVLACQPRSAGRLFQRRALPQPPQWRPAHVRYTAVGIDIRQLTRGTRGSKHAGRVAERKDQVTHSLTGTYDLSRTEPIGDRDRKQTGAGSESSACGKWSIKPRSARTKTNGRSCSRLNCQCAYADSSKQSQQLGFHCRAVHKVIRADERRRLKVVRQS